MINEVNYKFEVKTGTPLGRACVSIAEIRCDEIICKMAGPRITLIEFSEKYELDNGNPLQIGTDRYIDLIEPFVCFNHSCSPNAGIRNDGILFAIKDIMPGEEIQYDYSTTVDDSWWKMECRCGAKQCRRLIQDFQSIPHAQKEYYLSKNAISRHLKSVYY